MKIHAMLLTFAALAAMTARAEEPIVIKFSHVVARDTPKGKAADKFKELAEKATRGRVRVEVYPDSQLYSDKEEMEALQLGAAQMLAPSLAKFGQLGMREFEVFDLPFIFPNKEALNRVTQGWIGKGLLKNLESKGITGLTYWDNGFKVISANRPVTKPADMNGLRMRVQPSKALETQMRVLGAVPRTMGFADVYGGLKSGAVDGAENPPSNFFSQDMQEVQPYLTVTNHGYLGYAVIVNKKFWDGLPGNIRGELEGAMKEATAYANAIAQRENDNALEAIKRSGKTKITYLTDKDREEWKRALAPVQQEMEARIGRDLIQAVIKEAQTGARQAASPGNAGNSGASR